MRELASSCTARNVRQRCMYVAFIRPSRLALPTCPAGNFLSCRFPTLRVPRRPLQCVASNAIVEVEFTAPIASWGAAWGIRDGDTGNIYGDVSDDKFSVAFDMGESDLDPVYLEAGFYNYWFAIYLDNCDTSYTWSDNFVQVSYVDDEENTIDLSAFDDPDIYDPDTGTCCKYGSGHGAMYGK